MNSFRSEYWFSEKLRRGPSGVHGEGLFAKTDIPCGEILIEAGGMLVREEALPDQEEIPHSWLSIPGGRGKEVLYTPTKEPYLATYLNHSCEPNLKFDFPRWISQRPIIEGEEVFTDYTLLGYPASMQLLSECRCNRPGCRGLIFVPPAVP